MRNPWVGMARAPEEQRCLTCYYKLVPVPWCCTVIPKPSVEVWCVCSITLLKWCLDNAEGRTQTTREPKWSRMTASWAARGGLWMKFRAGCKNKDQENTPLPGSPPANYRGHARLLQIKGDRLEIVYLHFEEKFSLHRLKDLGLSMKKCRKVVLELGSWLPSRKAESLSWAKPNHPTHFRESKEKSRRGSRTKGPPWQSEEQGPGSRHLRDHTWKENSSGVTGMKGNVRQWLLILRQVEVKWSEVAQSCLTFCDPMDCSLPGSSVHGIFQARVLEWVAISFSRISS